MGLDSFLPFNTVVPATLVNKGPQEWYNHSLSGAFMPRGRNDCIHFVLPPQQFRECFGETYECSQRQSRVGTCQGKIHVPTLLWTKKASQGLLNYKGRSGLLSLPSGSYVYQHLQRPRRGKLQPSSLPSLQLNLSQSLLQIIQLFLQIVFHNKQQEI